ncbi:MAG TPA: helix-turn-helix transcriptional regulator [Alphaproteobacteria bacterium]|nr:helix-turn-helix transcriptional regulator [Alphaproteobacteria bacterium]
MAEATMESVLPPKTSSALWRGPAEPVPDLMNTREVAEYLRLKERKIYELVRQRRIPCTRVTGKWLFPKAQIDLWLAGTLEYRDAAAVTLQPAPPVIAGSHDPFLEWCLAESGCGLAMLGGGSVDGLRKLAAGRAMVAGAHILDPDHGSYNVEAIRGIAAGLDLVAIEWAVREQGLVVAPDNPMALGGPGDLTPAVRIAGRQGDAGSQILLRHLLHGSGVDEAGLTYLPQPARSELEVGLAVLDGRADVGLAIRAVARQLRLGFVPLHRERYDLILRRRDYFGEQFQALLSFARGAAAAAKAADLEGYDPSGLGRVRYNAPY